MMQIIGVLILHLVCLFFLQLLWRDKNKAIQRGTAFTKAGLVSKKKSPRLFYFSVWIDFLILLLLYAGLLAYTLVLVFR